MSLWVVLQVFGQFSQLHRIKSGLTASRYSEQALLTLRGDDFGPLMYRLSFHTQLPRHFNLTDPVFQQSSPLQAPFFHPLIITSIDHSYQEQDVYRSVSLLCRDQ